MSARVVLLFCSISSAIASDSDAEPNRVSVACLCARKHVYVCVLVTYPYTCDGALRTYRE